MRLFYILLFSLPCSPAFVHRGNHIVVKDEREITRDSIPDRTIIMNAFDVSAVKARKNKKELFYKLVDTLKYMIKAEMQRSSHRIVDITEQPFVNTGQDDSSIYRHYSGKTRRRMQ